MGLKNFLIGPMQEGLANRIEPFYLPEEAFYELEDAYIWRGKVRKRFGYSLIGQTELESRFRINVGTTTAVTGDFSVTIPGNIFAVGQMFSIGTTRFTVNATGAPATLLTTGTAIGTYNTTTGALVITGNTENPTTAVYFYPASPVMGLRTRETSSINAEKVIGFDTQFAYERTGGAWGRIGTTVWTGSNSQFFWSFNYRGANPYETYFYVVNNNSADNIKYLPSGSSTWTTLRPQLNKNADRFLETCRVLIAFKDRIIALNVIEYENETNRTYQNRARFSQNGDPRSPETSWRHDIPGKGGFIDAPTQEAIISAERLRDTLIVYFERSTWELVYVGNEAAPFKWQQLNDELGSESSFSIIGFDKTVLGVGNVGIHVCNGTNVNRIDEKIPNEVFKIHNGNSGPERVYGIRDFYNELIYWTFPNATSNPTFPTRILLYNYENGTWGFFNDSFTCFGNYQLESDLIWADVGDKFGTWQSWNTPWGSPFFQSAFPFILSGNQEGFVFILDNKKSSNSQSLYITDMIPESTLTIINHNLMSGDYILIEDGIGITDLNENIYRVQSVTDDHNIVIDTTFTGTYSGGAKATRISNLKILSKEFNPGTPVGQKISIPYVDFFLNRTSLGEVSLDYLIDTTDNDSIQDMVDPNILLGSNILYTRPEDDHAFQPNQQQIWHRYFIQSQGAFIQLKFFLSDEQMKNAAISQSDFQLHAIMLYIEPQGRITG